MILVAGQAVGAADFGGSHVRFLSFKLFEGKPLETSFGEDLYKKIFGAEAESQQAPPRLRAIA
jgi:hypothetical protein